MNSGCASRYFGRRTGRQYHRFPKASIVVDVPTHLVTGGVVDRGPKADDLEFHRLAKQAHRRVPFDWLLGDAGYDGEHHHAFLWDDLHVLGIIPPLRGRPSKSGKPPGTFFRRFLATCWMKAIYGQRWQVECTNSMLKRLLGENVLSRSRHTIDREVFLRILTLNLMIVLPLFVF